MVDRLLGLVERWLVRVEQARGFAALFTGLGLLLLLQMWPAAWIGNEEHYFQLAYRTFAPDAFSPYHAVAIDQSVGRFVPLYLMGAAVGLLGYDGAQALWRIVMALLYAAGIAYFFSALRLSVWDGLLVVVVFLLNGEQLIGGEWLFQGVETKTLAYAVLFFALGLALRRRWAGAAITASVATYLHFLVGGFWAVVILLQQWLETRERRGVLRSLVVYALLTLPQVALILWDRVAGAAPADAPVDKLYGARVPWHVAPFLSRREFWEWSWGIAPILALILVLGAIRVRHRTPGTPAAVVLRCALIGLVYLLFALLAAYLDRHAQVLAKFYVFRPSALALFLALTAIAALVSELLPDRASALKALLVFGLVATFSWRTFKTQVDRFREVGDTIPESAVLVAAIAEHTAPGDVLLFEPHREFAPDHLRLHRLARRPTLVAQKFLPTNPADILRWDSYVRMRKALFARGCPAPAGPARWLVTLRPETAVRLASCGPTLWQKGNISLIRVEPQK